MILQDADVNDTGLCRAMKRGSPVAKVQLWKTQVLGSLIGAHLRVKPGSILWARPRNNKLFLVLPQCLTKTSID